MTTFQLLIGQMALGIMTWTLIAWGLIYPALRSKSREEALTFLVIPQMFRHIGLGFIVPALVGPGVPADLAWQIASHDTFTAFLAMAAFGSLCIRARWAVPAVWAMNVFGAIDLICSVVQSSMVNISAKLLAGWYIPVVSVPIMFVDHVLIFATLARRTNKRRN